MTPVLSASGVSVRLGETEILEAVSLSVDKGAFVGLIGPNGSGKTTLLRTLAGLIPYEGSVRIDGREVREWRRRDLAQRLAFVRQFHALPFDFSVEELVLLGRTPHKTWVQGYDARDTARMEHALAALDVANYRHRSVQQLSGGELQRVLLAQALVQEADVLLLDEPTAHLDVHHQYSFLYAVRHQVTSERTAVAVFHDLELAARFADQLIVLSSGKAVATGSPASVLTPALLADVFRMQAEIGRGPGGDLRIAYTGLAM